DVQKSRPAPAVEGNAAAGRIDRSDARRIRRNAIESQRAAWFLESWRRRAVALEHLIAKLVDTQPAPRLVAISGVPRIDDDLNAAGKDEPAPSPFGQCLPLIVLQTDAPNRRRHMILEVHEPERKRVQLLARPADVQMDMIEAIDGANYLAGCKARTALHPHADECAVGVVHRREPSIGEGLAGFRSSDADVNVCDWSNADRLGQRPESADRHRARDHTVPDRRNESAFVGAHGD